MRILNGQVVLAVFGCGLAIVLLLMAGCAMDKFKMSIERGVVTPSTGVPGVAIPSAGQGS